MILRHVRKPGFTWLFTQHVPQRPQSGKPLLYGMGSFMTGHAGFAIKTAFPGRLSENGGIHARDAPEVSRVVRPCRWPCEDALFIRRFSV